MSKRRQTNVAKKRNATNAAVMAAMAAVVMALVAWPGAAGAQEEGGGPLLVPRSGGLYLPEGGVTRAAPGGRGLIQVYSYRRPRRTLSRQLIGLLRQHHWQITWSRRSPRGNLRMQIQKRRRVFRVSVAGRGVRSAIILTRSRATSRPNRLPPRRLRSILVPRFRGLRIPAGAYQSTAAPGGRGRIVVYSYRRTKGTLVQQLVKLLSRHGFRVLSTRRSPRGSIRMIVRKRRRQYRISIAGRGLRTAIILTR